MRSNSFVAYVFVPIASNAPKPAKNAAHQPVVFGYKKNARQPKMHLRLVDHHFDGLVDDKNVSLKPTLGPLAFADKLVNIATGKCVTVLCQIICGLSVGHSEPLRYTEQKCIRSVLHTSCTSLTTALHVSARL